MRSATVRSLGVFLPLALSACAGGPIRTGGDRPGWIDSPAKDARCISEQFLCAAGLTSVGEKAAPALLSTLDAAARAQLGAELASSVSTEVKSYASAKSAGGSTQETASTEASLSQVVKGFDLAAATVIVDRYREGDTAYAFILLDKAKARALQQGKVADKARSAEALVTQGDEKSKTVPAEALRAYARARSEADEALAGVLLLRVLGGKADLSAGAALAEGKLAGMVAGLKLSVESGGDQRAAPGKPLAQPVVFIASIGGLPAAGLPLSLRLEGGNLGGGKPELQASVGPDGKVSVRVDSVGDFATPRKALSASVDWARFTGETRAPAWAATLPLQAAEAVVEKKGLEATRVIVLLSELVENGKPVTEPPVHTALLKALSDLHVRVQDAKALQEKIGADKLAKIGPDELRAQAAGQADVAVVGTVIARQSGRFGATTVWATATSAVRVIDLGTGQVLQTFGDSEKGKLPGALDAAGRGALDALAEKLPAGVAKAVAAAAQ